MLRLPAIKLLQPSGIFKTRETSPRFIPEILFLAGVYFVIVRGLLKAARETFIPSNFRAKLKKRWIKRAYRKMKVSRSSPQSVAIQKFEHVCSLLGVLHYAAPHSTDFNYPHRNFSNARHTATLCIRGIFFDDSIATLFTPASPILFPLFPFFFPFLFSTAEQRARECK